MTLALLETSVISALYAATGIVKLARDTEGTAAEHVVSEKPPSPRLNR